MKFLFSLMLAAAASQAVVAGGTITFQGALVEPTCRVDAGEAARPAVPALVTASPQALGLKLSSCQASHVSMPPARGADGRLVPGAAEAMMLSAPVAELAGRAQVETVTLVYV